MKEQLVIYGNDIVFTDILDLIDPNGHHSLRLCDVSHHYGKLSSTRTNCFQMTNQITKESKKRID